MRRILSFAFAILILFNTIGYSYVLQWYEDELERKAEELIDSHVSEISGNLIFTTPVTSEYQTAMTDYTRIDGEFQFEGISYRMVKQKIVGNLMYVVCVNDQQTRIATDEINDIISTVSGQSNKESSSGAKVLSSFLKYCDASKLTEQPSSNGWRRTISFNQQEDNYSFDKSDVPFHPPAFI